MPDFIFMLTRQDRTVADAAAHCATALACGVRHIGFKDIGLPVEALHALAAQIRAGGATSYLEVVSRDPDSERRSVEAGRALGVDVLLGGTEVAGLDLLAWRAAGDVPALISAACAAVEKPVIVAGSIDSPGQIATLRQAGAAGFTIGTAALEGRFPAEGPALPEQLRAIAAA
ncbi:4-hydroxythreonine-4-phosphate dehydrogenase [Roseomonas sp. 18066]|uniref:4-hydroxythreonine-4-phosphate dehydrogenase n=1 Tax=Roseomonas sp. 18066 TaxID=2681412 RepID=UPI00135BD1D7|nr:4-hydroxythreonine-4-phosphate dehydrogenase [Roseomonas sp. 18066]